MTRQRLPHPTVLSRQNGMDVLDPVGVQQNFDRLMSLVGGVVAAAEAAGGLLPFADGSDGDAVLNGTNTVGWATLAGSTYTMTRDAFLHSLIVANGVTLIVAGCRIFSRGSVENNGTIQQNGNSASGTAAPAANPAATNVVLSVGSTGAQGSLTSGTLAFGGRFGAGNGGVGGAGASGAGGTISPQSLGVSPFHTVSHVLSGILGATTLTSPTSFGAGGNGGGDGTNRGGGAGNSGGMIVIVAPSVANAGTIAVIGGDGGTPPTGNCGGGGGGGGGVVLVYTLNAWSNTGSTNVNGGTGGAGVGSGTAGANGTAGTVLNVLLG